MLVEHSPRVSGRPVVVDLGEHLHGLRALVAELLARTLRGREGRVHFPFKIKKNV